MSGFMKFKFLIALKFNLMGFNFINKYQNLVISKSIKRHYKIVKLEVKNFEGLCCEVCIQRLKLIKLNQKFW